jgi:hypothetical protein
MGDAHQAKATRVIEDHRAPSVEDKADMVMRLVWGIAALQFEAAAHPEMNEQLIFSIQVEEQILSAAPDIEDSPTAQARLEVAGYPPPQTALCDCHRTNHRPLQPWQQRPADGFDFRQFWHSFLLSQEFCISGRSGPSCLIPTEKLSWLWG